MANQMNMTEGRLFGKILRFTLPLILTNILQVFYNVADMIIVSLSSEPDAVGAVGMTGVASGNHLHFELRVDDDRINPMYCLGGVGDHIVNE